MKKVLFYLFLTIFSKSAFCAQAQAKEDEAPLYVASINGNLKLVRHLIKKGATKNITFNVHKLIYEIIEIIFKRESSLEYLTRGYHININYHEIIKAFLINGVDLRDVRSACRNDDKKLKIFDEILNKIVSEYRRKINYYNQNYPNQQLEHLLDLTTLPKDVIGIAQQYLETIPEYTDDQIISNIVAIRKTLGELDENGIEIEQPVQAHPAAAAAHPPVPIRRNMHLPSLTITASGSGMRLSR